MNLKALSGRRIVLVVVLVAIGAAVVADRFGGEPADGAHASATATAHRDAAGLLAQEQALLASAPDILRARDEAKSQWQTLETRLVRARTVELARSAVRQSLLDVLERDAISPRVQPAAFSGTIEANAKVQPIVQQVSFDAATPERAYTLLDRLANMPNQQTRLTDLRISGPGIKNVKQSIQVRVTVETLAYIAEDANG